MKLTLFIKSCVNMIDGFNKALHVYALSKADPGQEHRGAHSRLKENVWFGYVKFDFITRIYLQL